MRNSFAGKSRSASIVIAYLMKECHMSFEKAYKLVVSKRAKASPNASFVKQLKEFGDEVALEDAEAKTAAEENFIPN